MPTPRRLQVFLCHASQDKSKVRELYERLTTEPWIDPWLDVEKLLPGQDWNLEIEKALRAADMIIVCLSKESVSKEGYVQREFRRVVSYAEEKLEGTSYIIPLRLDDCETPYKFQQWQWLDYSAKNAWEKLLMVLRARAEKFGIDHGSAPTVGVGTVSKPHPEPAGFTSGGRPFYTFAGMEFVKVPAGDFYMGADDIEDASPQHLIYKLDYDFYIGRYPVTNQEFSLFLRDRERPIPIARFQMKLPIVNVFWNHADDYIDWLNNMHDTELPTGHMFRLPSEAEWEKAARGVDGNDYPWGNDFDERRCNSYESGVGKTTPVGKFSPQGDSAFGAADMAGNVWEWTRSLASRKGLDYRYPYRFDDNREEHVVDEEAEYILRGGSFSTDKSGVRTANRIRLKIIGSATNEGFRVAICPIKN